MTDVVLWAAVQGVGTLLAAVAAIIALVIAGQQLGQLIASNELLAASNAAVTESNVALTRPYVVIDFELVVGASRSGDIAGTSVLVTIRNDGKTPAHNITMKADRAFKPSTEPDQPGWRRSIDHLNRLTNGGTVLRSLTNSRPLRFYLDDEHLFGTGDEPGPVWTVHIRYEDSNGRAFEEDFTLEVEPWRLSIASAEQLAQVGKYVDAVAQELKTLNRLVKTNSGPRRRFVISPEPEAQDPGGCRSEELPLTPE